ncbi:dihydroxy-acid dehydratase [Blastococcus tunisiensis]|uniref:Dihydroxyacid dehydratase n=1 Tax=Blastococcus tunisiensis TaxID=1798228 RepID=A0A1I1WNP5_9ACTN|nr:dihydroxy-acid dehydratase [Blastococcus sp. DSM 46838]SFD96591.1 dihydroxyacid dehydratase [Blastococcus sp. DSM 46838]
MTQAGRPLRSNLQEGSSRWAVRRAQWRALGISDEDMTKPKIAVVNSSSKLAICFSHLDGIVPVVEEAIRAAGGLPFEVRTAAPSDFITSAGRDGRYILPSRDLIPNDIEVAVEGAQLDGMVTLASCDKTAPAHLMAAARLDIPSIVVGCGYQPSGEYRGEHVDIEEVFLAAGSVAAGRMSLEHLCGMADNAIRGPGVCAGLGTANTMHMACEALGMSLTGTTPVLANSPAMWDGARRAGARIVELVTAGLRPRQVMTPAAFRNAVTVMLAISGSVNSIKHLQAVAHEAAVDVDVPGLFAELADRVPLLCAVRPNGPHFIEDLEAAGGTRAVLAQLADLLDLDVRTVDGGTLREALAGSTPTGSTVADEEVVRPLDRPFAAGPSIVVVHGSLAPGGAVVKRPVIDRGSRRFEGTALCFSSRDEALEALGRGKVRPGTVLVVRGLGVVGGPGMALGSAVVFALEGAGLGDTVAVVTDGQMSGLVNVGTVVGEVTPEAALGGPLALVEDGDRIVIDVDRRTVDLEVPDDVLAARRQRLGTPEPGPDHGWLSAYRRLVTPVAAGAVLTAAAPGRGPGPEGRRP